VFLLLTVFGMFLGMNAGSVYSMAGGLPPKYMGALFLGQGIAGIGAVVLRASSLVMWPTNAASDNFYIGCMAYVLVTSGFIMFCGMLQFRLKHNDFAVYHLWQNPGFKPRYDFNPMNSFISDSMSDGGMSDRLPSPMILSKRGPVLDRSDSYSDVSNRVRSNFRKTKGLLYAIVFVIFITLMLFPASVTDTYLNLVDSRGLSESWYQLLIIFLFNVSDTSGRVLAGKFDLAREKVVFWSYFRVLFIATFLLTDFKAAPRWLWDTDWFKILNLVAFAMSNGYLATLCAIKAPGTVKEHRRA
jgi:hypothetical protein